jgi:chromosomal replication initiator protein
MEKDYKIVWNNRLGIIRDTLNSENLFNTWFRPIVPLQLEDGVLTIQVPSSFFYEWLEEHYIDLLRKVVRRELGPKGQLRYSVVMDQSISDNQGNVLLPSTGRRAIRNAPKDVPININTENLKELPNPFTIPGIQKVKVHSQLNENYTLENFVEGECNRLARSAGYAVAENPGRTAFNPLLLYGNAGLGKTHLAHAIGIKTKEKYPDKTVLYVTAEQFSQQFREATINNTVPDFMHFYEMIDVLIIDDIFVWEGRVAKTQEAFFHIFNYLHQRNKQIGSELCRRYCG